MPILPTYYWMAKQVALNNADRSLACDADCGAFEGLSSPLRFDYFQFSVGPDGLWWDAGLGPTNPDQSVGADINENAPNVNIIEVEFSTIANFQFTEITDGSGNVIGLKLPITYIGIGTGGPNFSWQNDRLNIEVAATDQLLITGYGIGSIYGTNKKLLFVGSHQAICLASGDTANCDYNFLYYYSP